MNTRSKRLLEHFLTSSSVSVAEMISTLNISKRQLRYTIHVTNDMFHFHRFATQLVLVNEYIILVNPTAPHAMKALLEKLEDYHFSQNERLYLLTIFIYAHSKYISHIHLQQLLGVSKNTVYNDLLQLQQFLQPFLLKVYFSRTDGYQLIGDEWKKRAAVFLSYGRLQTTFTDNAFKNLITTFGSYEHFQLVQKTVLQTMQYHVEIHAEKKLQDACFLLFCIWNQAASATALTPRNLLSPCDYLDVFEILQQHFSPRSSYEAQYINVLFKTTKMVQIDEPFEQEIAKIMQEITTSIITRFECIIGAPTQHKEHFISGLIVHLQALYYRLLYDIPTVHPDIHSIKKMYAELFTIVTMLLKPIGETFATHITEDEVAYVTMHFAAACEMPKMSAAQKKKALIYCSNGVGTSAMIELQLQTIFPEFIFTRMYHQEKLATVAEQFDVIFSTVPLPKLNVPTFVIPTILTLAKRQSLTQDVYQRLYYQLNDDLSLKRSADHLKQPIEFEIQQLLKIIQKYATVLKEEQLLQALSVYLAHTSPYQNKGGFQPMLTELLTPDYCQFVEAVTSWEEAITLSAQPLLHNGAITQAYIAAMIQNVKDFGTYMLVGNRIAIPHARPEQGATQVGLSFLKLQQPVSLLDNPQKQVQIFFTLSAVDSSTHLKALSQLSTLLLDDTICKQLLQIQNVEDLFILIHEHLERN